MKKDDEGDTEVSPGESYMGEERRNAEDRWTALFRIVEAHRVDSVRKQNQLSDDIKNGEERILGAIEKLRREMSDKIDHQLEKHEEKIEKRIKDDLVLKVEFTPIQRGFYGICLTFFAGFIGFLWKIVGRQ